MSHTPFPSESEVDQHTESGLKALCVPSISCSLKKGAFSFLLIDKSRNLSINTFSNTQHREHE